MRIRSKIVYLSLICMMISHLGFAAPLKVGFVMGTGGLGDQSFNDITYVGLVKAQREHGLELAMQGGNENSAAARETLIKSMLQKQMDIILVNGWEYLDLVRKFASQNPQVKFILNDVGISDIPNVSSTEFAQHEGSFLAGAFAAMMSKTKKIGFIGGVNMPVIQAFQVGYHEGAVYIDPNIKISELMVTKEGDFSGFNNPKEGHRLATELYQQGIDIIFAAAGLTGNGVIKAAQEKKQFAIGVDSDQDHMAKGVVLTSMMKRLDQSAYHEIEKIVKGQFKAGIHSYGIKEGGVSLSPMKFTKNMVPEEVLNKLKVIESDIISGKIKVTDAMKSVKP